MNSPLCSCGACSHDPKLVVLTGGPGAGKTAVLDLIRADVPDCCCAHKLMETAHARDHRP